MLALVTRRDDATLGDFLRCRRAAFDPAHLPLPSYGRRRVPGIRREELAVLAGVSTSYYTRIEQGAVTASPAVLEAIASALDLCPEDRGYLMRLARTRDYGPPTTRGSRPPLSAGLRGFLGDATAPVGVLDRALEVVGWNRLANAVFAPHLLDDDSIRGPSAIEPDLNWVQAYFLEEASRSLFDPWEDLAADLVGRLRESLAAHPDDDRVRANVDTLLDHSQDFARLWQDHLVREGPLGQVRLRHPLVGTLDLYDLTMRPTDEPDLLVIIFQPVVGTGTDRRLQELRAMT